MKVQVISPKGSHPAAIHIYCLPFEIEQRLYSELKRHKEDSTLEDSLDIILRGTEFEGWQLLYIYELDSALTKLGMTIEEFSNKHFKGMFASN